TLPSSPAGSTTGRGEDLRTPPCAPGGGTENAKKAQKAKTLHRVAHRRPVKNAEIQSDHSIPPENKRDLYQHPTSRRPHPTGRKCHTTRFPIRSAQSAVWLCPRAGSSCSREYLSLYPR